MTEFLDQMEDFWQIVFFVRERTMWTEETLDCDCRENREALFLKRWRAKFGYYEEKLCPSVRGIEYGSDEIVSVLQVTPFSILGLSSQ